MKTRKTLLAALTGALAIGAAAFAAMPAHADLPPPARRWKSEIPSCGCCGGWVKHMQAAGFTVKVHDIEDVQPVKTASGVPDALGSCHTAKVGGYVVEGHVPAKDVLRLLAEKPKATGLSAPECRRTRPAWIWGPASPTT